jgi:hypothetical protein
LIQLICFDAYRFEQAEVRGGYGLAAIWARPTANPKAKKRITVSYSRA